MGEIKMPKRFRMPPPPPRRAENTGEGREAAATAVWAASGEVGWWKVKSAGRNDILRITPSALVLEDLKVGKTDTLIIPLAAVTSFRVDRRILGSHKVEVTTASGAQNWKVLDADGLERAFRAALEKR